MAKKNEIDSPIARHDDGTIQITLTLSKSDIEHEKAHALKHMAESVNVPGFRKGMAPLDMVEERVDKNQLIEHILNHLLPKVFSQAITTHKIQPVSYPKFEIIRAQFGEDWQVRATTCEIPEVDLKDYKKKVEGEIRGKSLWTPEKGKEEKELPREQKENIALQALLSTIPVKVPAPLIEEETNSRLSQLLARIEKLGLTLESYLASINKKAEDLRNEYEKQATDAIALDILLSKIADLEGVAVSDTELDAAMKASEGDTQLAEKLKSPEQKRIVEAVLRKRKVLDTLVHLL